MASKRQARRSGAADLTRAEAAEILGVGVEADAAELRRAFRALARALHPDRNPSADAAARFARAREAYELLLTPVAGADGREGGHASGGAPETRRASGAGRAGLEDLEQAELDADLDLFFRSRGDGFSGGAQPGGAGKP